MTFCSAPCRAARRCADCRPLRVLRRLASPRLFRRHPGPLGAARGCPRFSIADQPDPGHPLHLPAVGGATLFRSTAEAAGQRHPARHPLPRGALPGAGRPGLYGECPGRSDELPVRGYPLHLRRRSRLDFRWRRAGSGRTAPAVETSAGDHRS